MRQRSIRFLTILLCLATLLCLLPMAASAATLSKPTELKWNTTLNWSTNPPTVMTKNGSITWKANEPYASNGPTHFQIKVYRNDTIWFEYIIGFGSSNLERTSGLAEFDLAPPMTWDSGKYYFTIQAIPDPNTDDSSVQGSAIAKSTTITYTKPSDKLAAPTNVQWDFPWVTWTGPSDHVPNYHVEMLYSETASGERQHFHSQWNIHDTRNAPPNFLIEEGLRPGYYHVRVRSISNDINEIQNSDWTDFKTYHYTGMNAPELTVSNKASTGKPSLSWNEVPNAAKYQVYRSTSKTGSYTLLKTTTGTTFVNTGAEAGKLYYYKVRAVDAAGNKSDFSGIVSRTCDLPAPVISLSNVASSGKVKISWEPVDGAVKYEVYRSTSKSGSYTKLLTTSGTSMNNTSAVAGQLYYYKVRAIASASAANSAYSSVKSRTCDLPAPVISLSNVASSGKVRITWEPVDGAVKYSVYRSDSKDGTYTKLITTSGTSVTNNSAVAGQRYYYKVFAVASASAANSAYSSPKYHTCDLPRPSVTLSVNAKGRPVVQWEEIDGAEKYQVYRSTSKDGTYTRLYTTSGTRFVNTSAVSGQTYYYKVRAVCSNTSGNSAYSSVKSITAG